MTKYKLTDRKMRTRGDCQWVVGEAKETLGYGGLCGPGWLHYYHSPELAILLNPIHAAITDPRLWECEAEGEHLDDDGMKGGCTRMTLVRELLVVPMSGKQRVYFAISCARVGRRESAWDAWADRWVSGEDRSGLAAECAANKAPSWSATRAAGAAVALSGPSDDDAYDSRWYAARAAYAASGASLGSIDLVALARQASAWAG